MHEPMNLQTPEKIMSQNKISIYGLFPGGDPRKFSSDASTASEEQQNALRLDCEKWDTADASGQILCSEPSQETRYHATTARDYSEALYGWGFYDFESPSEPRPEATELDAAELEKILQAPSQNLSFRAVLG